MEQQVTLARPRLKLKAKIFDSGYPTIREFAAIIGYDSRVISRILSGSEYPSARLQLKLLEGLKLSSDELQQLL